MKRSLTGIQPSGVPHVGNWLGAIEPALALQSSYQSFYFIASYHALTTSKDPALLRERIMDVARTWLAMGLDPEKTTLWVQHDVPEVCELSWILSCVTSKGMLDKAHAFKDAVAKGRKQISAGLYTYPILMAADILAFHANVVPVGKDQKQHVEMAKDMAQSLNHMYGDVLTPPEPMIQDSVATVPGIDGQKMSKSYDNTIPLFLKPKKLRKRIMSIKTDSKGLEEPKDPTHCNVFKLYELFASPAQCDELAQRYRKGNFGYGHAKQELFLVMNEKLEEPRERYEQFVENSSYVSEVLHQGAKNARTIAKSTLEKVRGAVGL
ncbi:MAG: tryptophan--tRNA ligase [Myxococcota bacterium]|nr:tryptophan--tRNA ligase [Myxococcota bacterium]